MVFITPTQSANKEPFVDLNTNFQLDDRSLLVSNFQAIINQIYNILSTSIGERIFEPEFGSNLGNYLFDPTDEDTGWLIENEIFRALGRWMPRIELVRSQTRATPVKGQRLFEVQIRYRIVELQTFDTINFVYHQAGSNNA